MKTSRFTRLLLPVALVAGLSVPASARELTTLDGGQVVLQAVVAPSEPAAGRSAQQSVLRAGIAWVVRDGQGRHHEGVLPGTGSVRDALPLLVQNPADGEIHLIYPALHQGSKDLFLRTWLGQTWSEAVWLAGAPDSDDVRPRAAFTASGDVLLAWIQQRSNAEHVLFQYGEVGAEGMRHLSAHVDMGRAGLYTLPVDGDVRLAGGVSELRTDATGDRALLFLADPDAEDVGVLRLDLRALRQIIGGGSFAPVPVNFLQVAMGGVGGVADRVAEAGDVLPAWRVELLDGEAYYWFDEATMSGLAFRDGAVRGGLVTLALPAEEISAHALMVARLRLALGRIEAEVQPIIAREDATRERRLR